MTLCQISEEQLPCHFLRVMFQSSALLPAPPPLNALDILCHLIHDTSTLPRSPQRFGGDAFSILGCRNSQAAEKQIPALAKNSR